ncbi:MAG: hypothetical protein RI911_779 [Candidatus Parcubacteria bacterium]|jgi:hypothetical protein
MLLMSIVCWWCIVVGFFNTALRARGYSYTRTPVKTSLFYLSACVITIGIFAPMHMSWQPLTPLGSIPFIAIIGTLIFLDRYIATTFPSADVQLMRNASMAKYTDILLQQLLIFLLFVSVQDMSTTMLWTVSMFTGIFGLLHAPVFFIMPRHIAWTFFIASCAGGIIFATLYSTQFHSAPYITFAIHALFYSTLRACEHNSDSWVRYMERD